MISPNKDEEVYSRWLIQKDPKVEGIDLISPEAMEEFTHSTDATRKCYLEAGSACGNYLSSPNTDP